MSIKRFVRARYHHTYEEQHELFRRSCITKGTEEATFVLDIKRHNYQNRTRSLFSCINQTSMYPRLFIVSFFPLLFAGHNWRETASLHCRLVTTFRFFADDFFQAVYSPTDLPPVCPPARLFDLRHSRKIGDARCVSLRAVFFLPKTNDCRTARLRESGERDEKGLEKIKRDRDNRERENSKERSADQVTNARRGKCY